MARLPAPGFSLLLAPQHSDLLSGMCLRSCFFFNYFFWRAEGLLILCFFIILMHAYVCNCTRISIYVYFLNSCAEGGVELRAGLRSEKTFAMLASSSCSRCLWAERRGGQSLLLWVCAGESGAPQPGRDAGMLPGGGRGGEGRRGPALPCRRGGGAGQTRGGGFGAPRPQLAAHPGPAARGVILGCTF